MTMTIPLSYEYTIVPVTQMGTPGFHVHCNGQVLRDLEGNPYFSRTRNTARKTITRDRRRRVAKNQIISTSQMATDSRFV